MQSMKEVAIDPLDTQLFMHIHSYTSKHAYIQSMEEMGVDSLDTQLFTYIHTYIHTYVPYIHTEHGRDGSGLARHTIISAYWRGCWQYKVCMCMYKIRNICACTGNQVRVCVFNVCIFVCIIIHVRSLEMRAGIMYVYLRVYTYMCALWQ